MVYLPSWPLVSTRHNSARSLSCKNLTTDVLSNRGRCLLASHSETISALLIRSGRPAVGWLRGVSRHVQPIGWALGSHILPSQWCILRCYIFKVTWDDGRYCLCYSANKQIPRQHEYYYIDLVIVEISKMAITSCVNVGHLLICRAGPRLLSRGKTGMLV